MIDLNSLTSFESLFLTIIGEARGEPIESQVGVGCVIRNRLHEYPGKYKDYKDVCFEPKQFSCWNKDDPNRPYLLELAEKLITGYAVEDPHLRQCILVATGIKDWAIVDNTKSALNYMTTRLFNSEQRPPWAKNPKKVVELGNHTFFTA